MIPKVQVRLRWFLVACVVVGAVVGIGLRWRWGSRIYSGSESLRYTDGGTRYSVSWMWQAAAFERPSLLNCVIVLSYPDNAARSSHTRKVPSDSGLEILSTGVFYRKQRIGGFGTSRVVIALPANEVKVIPISPEELQALDAAVGYRLLESPVWKKQIEPKIDDLAPARDNKRQGTQFRLGSFALAASGAQRRGSRSREAVLSCVRALTTQSPGRAGRPGR